MVTFSVKGGTLIKPQIIADNLEIPLSSTEHCALFNSLPASFFSKKKKRKGS